jgi:hypothetical protein
MKMTIGMLSSLSPTPRNFGMMIQRQDMQTCYQSSGPLGSVASRRDSSVWDPSPPLSGPPGSSPSEACRPHDKGAGNPCLSAAAMSNHEQRASMSPRDNRESGTRRERVRGEEARRKEESSSSSNRIRAKCGRDPTERERKGMLCCATPEVNPFAPLL